MVDLDQIRELCVRPALKTIGYHTEDAENIVMGTGLQESRFMYIKQNGGGPALGFFQMEPNTAHDIWDNFVDYKPVLRAKLAKLMAPQPNRVLQLTSNIQYAAAMCRIHYLRQKGAIPSSIDGMAEYWKVCYNTPLGAGHAFEFSEKYREFLA